MKKLFFLLLGFPVLAFAQHDSSNSYDSIACSFSGTVVDEYGNPLEWVTVFLQDNNRVISACQTDNIGKYKLTGHINSFRNTTITFSYLT